MSHTRMSKSAVYDATHDGKFYGHISKGIEAATADHKSFILWNDRVYAILGDGSAWDTNLTVKDLD